VAESIANSQHCDECACSKRNEHDPFRGRSSGLGAGPHVSILEWTVFGQLIHQ